MRTRDVFTWINYMQSNKKFKLSLMMNIEIGSYIVSQWTSLPLYLPGYHLYIKIPRNWDRKKPVSEYVQIEYIKSGTTSQPGANCMKKQSFIFLLNFDSGIFHKKFSLYIWLYKELGNNTFFQSLSLMLNSQKSYSEVYLTFKMGRFAKKFCKHS